MGIEHKGAVTFRADNDDPDWTYNSRGYDFGPFVSERISARATKHPDSTFEVTVDGPFEKSFTFKEKTPTPGSKGIQVSLAWSDNEIRLVLNGETVATQAAS